MREAEYQLGKCKINCSLKRRRRALSVCEASSLVVCAFFSNHSHLLYAVSFKVLATGCLRQGKRGEGEGGRGGDTVVSPVKC